MTPKPASQPPNAAPENLHEAAGQRLTGGADPMHVAIAEAGAAPQAPGMPSELLKAPRYDRGGAYVLVEDYDALRAEAKRLEEENSDWQDAQRDLYEINAILAQRIERLEAELKQARGEVKRLFELHKGLMTEADKRLEGAESQLAALQTKLVAPQSLTANVMTAPSQEGVGQGETGSAAPTVKEKP